MVKALKFLLPSALLAAAIFFACTKTDDTLTTEEAIDQALFTVQERGGLGSYGCYEVIFPVTIQLPNQTTVEVDSYEEIARQLRAYYETNGRPKRGEQPAFTFVYPMSVLTQDGQIITLESEQQLRRLRTYCEGVFNQHNPNGHSQNGVACFEILYPVIIVFPDGTTARAENRRMVNHLINTWKQNNPASTEHPTIGFPLTVKIRRTGAVITIHNAEELRRLRNSCR